MKRHERSARTLALALLVLTLFAATWASSPREARADIAPPEQPAGSSLAPGGGTTQVVMQSEQVILVVQPEPWSGVLPAEEKSRGVTRDWAMVEAHFVMRNDGPRTEGMTVRFPLSAPLYPGAAASEIQDLTVHVNGRAAATRRIEAPLPSQAEAVSIGWAAFDVDFPPGVEVRIDVTYSLRATGYADQDSRFVYLLGTGAGWSGSIGRAEITLRLPYPASRENIVDYDATWMSEGYKLTGSQITWHYDDFEPDADQVVVVTLLAQDLWEAVLRAEPAVIEHPDDGGAWGTLARALKLAVCTEKGYWPRKDVGGILLVERSIAAYERATDFAPHEARWHAGYSELLIKLAPLDDASDPLLQRAVEHLNLALAIEPDNEQALQVLEALRWSPAVSVQQAASGARVVIVTATSEASLPTATATFGPTPSMTAPVPTHTPAVAAVTQTPSPAASGGGLCAGGAVMVSIASPVLVGSVRRRRHTGAPLPE